MRHILFLAPALFFSMLAQGATYSLTYYELTGDPATPNNFFTDFRVSGSAVFSIDDAAVTPGNLVRFDDSEFLAFDASLSTTIGGGQLTLGIDDFPPRASGTSPQGILFDGAGLPLRFDTPTTIAGNGARICDPSCTFGIQFRATLRMWDDNNFEVVYLDDGTITTATQAMNEGEPFTPLNGRWDFSPLGTISAIPGAHSYYQISQVPIPAAAWLFASALIGLVGVKRRKVSQGRPA